jgi:hypothetical protein
VLMHNAITAFKDQMAVLTRLAHLNEQPINHTLARSIC